MILFITCCIYYLFIIIIVIQIIDPDNAVKIDNVISQLTKCHDGEMKFTLVLDDASGNSFIENPQAPELDPHMTVVYYTRQPEQDAKLGIQPAAEEEGNEDEGKGDVEACLFVE